MQLSTLTVEMMLNLTGSWLEDKVFRAACEAAGHLGLGILEKLELVHDPLAKVGAKREAAQSSVVQLTELIAILDGRHDSKARALFGHLSALAEGSDDPERRAFYLNLQRQLFPRGLRIIKKPYIEEAGAALAMLKTVDAKTRAALAAIVVGEQTLDQLFEAWMAAGVELGKAVKKRAELRASLAREGSAVNEVDVAGAQREWVNAVGGLLWVIGSEASLAALDEPVRAAIGQAIDVAQGRQARGSAAKSEGGEDEDESEDGGEELDDGGDDDEGEDDESGEPDDEGGELDDEDDEPDVPA